MINTKMEQLDHKYDVNLERILNLECEITKKLKNQYQDIIDIKVRKGLIIIKMMENVHFKDLKEIYDSFEDKKDGITLHSVIDDECNYIKMIINI